MSVELTRERKKIKGCLQTGNIAVIIKIVNNPLFSESLSPCQICLENVL